MAESSELTELDRTQIARLNELLDKAIEARTDQMTRDWTVVRRVFLAMAATMLGIWLIVEFVLNLMMPTLEPIVGPLNDDESVCHEGSVVALSGTPQPLAMSEPVTAAVASSDISKAANPGSASGTVVVNARWREAVDPLVRQMCADANAWRRRHLWNYYLVSVLAVLGLVAAGLAQLGVALTWPCVLTLLLQTSGTLALGIMAAFPLSARAEMWRSLYVNTESLVYELKYDAPNETKFEGVRAQYNLLRKKSSEDAGNQRAGEVISGLLTNVPTPTRIPATPTVLGTIVVSTNGVTEATPTPTVSP